MPKKRFFRHISSIFGRKNFFSGNRAPSHFGDCHFASLCQKSAKDFRLGRYQLNTIIYVYSFHQSFLFNRRNKTWSRHSLLHCCSWYLSLVTLPLSSRMYSHHLIGYHILPFSSRFES